MRISDWSSDVCSSDLEGAIAGGDEIDETDARRHEGRADQQRGGNGETGDPGEAAGITVADGLGDPFIDRVDDADAGFQQGAEDHRSEERRVGKECVGQGRSRWSPYH